MRLLLLNLLVLFCIYPAVGQTRRDDKKLLDDARNVYSTLRRQGLVEVRASLIPNWRPLFKDVPSARKPLAQRLANRLRFSILADKNGKILVTHRIFGPKPDKATTDILDNLAKGIELSATGFLMSWSPFMLTWLIPEDLEQFVLQELDSRYVLSFQDSGVDVSVAMTKDLLMTELRTPQGTVRPSLMRTAAGYVLTGYQASNDDAIVGHVELKARVVSEAVRGMLLPKTVFLEGTSGKIPFNFELRFTNYRLKVR